MLGTSPVVQWLRLRLPVQQLYVPSLVRELGSLWLKKTKHKKRSNVVTNSIMTLKMVHIKNLKKKNQNSEVLQKEMCSVSPSERHLDRVKSPDFELGLFLHPVLLFSQTNGSGRFYTISRKSSALPSVNLR